MNYIPDKAEVLAFIPKLKKYFVLRSQQFLIVRCVLRQSSTAVTASIPVASSSIRVVIVIVELPTLIN